VSRAIQLGIPVFIHVSSMAVYGHVRHDVVSANTPIRHQSPFGISKWAAEAFLSAKSNEIRCVSVRSPAIVGRVSHRHFLSELLKELLLNSPVVSVSNPSFLFNNVVHQSQFAQFLIHLAKSPPPSFVAVPIGSTEPIPLSEIVAMLIEAAKYKGVLRWTQPTTAPFSIDISSAIELGFNPIKTRESIALWMKDVKG
jgi:nucleoside-diphosphate-sugar epimerase